MLLYILLALKLVIFISNIKCLSTSVTVSLLSRVQLFNIYELVFLLLPPPSSIRVLNALRHTIMDVYTLHNNLACMNN